MFSAQATVHGKVKTALTRKKKVPAFTSASVGTSMLRFKLLGIRKTVDRVGH